MAHTMYHTEDLRDIVALESMGKFYGPMPVEQFFDSLLPVNNGTDAELKGIDGTDTEDAPHSSETADFSEVPEYDSNEGITEQMMYQPLVERMNEYSWPFQFLISASGTATTIKTRPDIGLTDLNRSSKPSTDRVVHPSTVMKRANRRPARPVLPTTDPFDWSRCELSCEVKRSADADPFYDSGSFYNLTDQGWNNLGQLVIYYKEQALRQHRTFIFHIFVFGSFARFFRWDRSGAVVTQKFNYKKKPQLLAGFLWRYAQLDLVGRGWDISFTLADSADARLFDTELKRVLRERPAETASGVAKTTYRAIEAMNVQENQSGEYSTYTVDISPSATWDFATTLIIREPLYEPLSPFGRATRTYLAYDKDHEEFRFFKDNWRVDDRSAPDLSQNESRHRSEDEFYTLMKRLNIPRSGIPKVYYAGDVKNEDRTVQRTITSELPWNDPGVHEWRKACLPFRAHIHQHVVQELLCPLHAFESSKEFLGIISDVLKVMKAVKDEAQILHRDIGVGNIMFRIGDDNKIQGVLNGWDNNGPVQDECPTRSLHDSQETGMFMSLDLLRERNARHEFRHDVESAVLWVPTYIALRYLPHTYPNMRTHRSAYPPIESPAVQITCVTGESTEKEYLLFNPTTKIKLESNPLDNLLGNVFTIFRKYYGLLPMAAGTPDPEEREQLAREVHAIRQNLNDPDYFIDIFDRYTGERVDWPVSDRCDDRFPPTEKDLQDLERFKNAFNTRERLRAHCISRAVVRAPSVQHAVSPVNLLPLSTTMVTLSARHGRQPRAAQSIPPTPIAGPSQRMRRKRSSPNEPRPPGAEKQRKTRGRP